MRKILSTCSCLCGLEHYWKFISLMKNISLNQVWGDWVPVFRLIHIVWRVHDKNAKKGDGCPPPNSQCDLSIIFYPRFGVLLNQASLILSYFPFSSNPGTAERSVWAQVISSPHFFFSRVAFLCTASGQLRHESGIAWWVATRSWLWKNQLFSLICVVIIPSELLLAPVFLGLRAVDPGRIVRAKLPRGESHCFFLCMIYVSSRCSVLCSCATLDHLLACSFRNSMDPWTASRWRWRVRSIDGERFSRSVATTVAWLSGTSSPGALPRSSLLTNTRSARSGNHRQIR